MEQNTKEWLKWRAEGIGASDAPAIMGLSEFKTKLQLWREKFSKEVIEKDEEENTFIQDKGHRLEATARAEFEFEKGFDFKPALFTHKDFPIFRASLDGWSAALLWFWEHKYIGKDLFLRAQNEELSLMERIPRKYIPQIAQQFLVTNAKGGTLSLSCDSLHEDKRVAKYHLDIPQNEEMQEYIKMYFKEALEFWKSVEEGIEPEPEKEDKIEIDDEELIGFLNQYGEFDVEKKKYDAKIKKLRTQIEPKISHTRMIYDRFTITKVKGKERVDYKAAFEAFCGWVCQMKKEAGPDDVFNAVKNFPDKPSLVNYTKADKDSFKVTIAKKKKEVKAEVSDANPVTGEKVVTFDEPLKEAPEIKVDNSGPPSDVDPRVSEWQSMTPEQQSVQAAANGFKNPITGKAPRSWAKKNRKEMVKYLKGQANSEKATGDQAREILELAEKLEKLEQQINA